MKGSRRGYSSSSYNNTSWDKRYIPRNFEGRMLPKIDNKTWWKLPPKQRQAIQEHNRENRGPKPQQGTGDRARNTNKVVTNETKENDEQKVEKDADSAPKQSNNQNKSSIVAKRKAKFISRQFMSESRRIQISEKLNK